MLTTSRRPCKYSIKKAPRESWFQRLRRYLKLINILRRFGFSWGWFSKCLPWLMWTGTQATSWNGSRANFSASNHQTCRTKSTSWTTSSKNISGPNSLLHLTWGIRFTKKSTSSFRTVFPSCVFSNCTSRNSSCNLIQNRCSYTPQIVKIFCTIYIT